MHQLETYHYLDKTVLRKPFKNRFVYFNPDFLNVLDTRKALWVNVWTLLFSSEDCNFKKIYWGFQIKVIHDPYRYGFDFMCLCLENVLFNSQERLVILSHVNWSTEVRPCIEILFENLFFCIYEVTTWNQYCRLDAKNESIWTDVPKNQNHSRIAIFKKENPVKG